MSITNFTPLIHVVTKEYPIYLPKVRKDNQLNSFSAFPTAEQLRDLGYEVVEPTVQPAGDVVTQGDPVLEDGVWKQHWNVRQFTPEETATLLEEKRTQHLDAIRRYQDKLLEKGIPYEFNSGTYSIQVRDGDRANLAGMRIFADSQIQGETAFPASFRTKENVNVSLTPQEVVDMTNAALVGYYQLLESVWELKDLTRIVDTIEDFPVIPEI